ncbi:hypothetical protein [Streptomyces sp. DW26H14]|uniref:hypothetical protein n=1 Tax=Streptomyces sp. DW26H14 TaxID=3435395 RepID=UPI00403E06CF
MSTFPPEANLPARCAHGDADPSEPPIVHWYACERLSVAEIARRTGMSRARITGLLTASGIVVGPRGAGQHRGSGLSSSLGAKLADLYVKQGLTSTEIGERLGMSERTVRQRLAAYGIPRRRKGHAGQILRRQLPLPDLRDLYVRRELTAEHTANRLGTTRGVVLTNAHELGLSVRLGGPAPATGPRAIRLVSALYADSLVRAALRRHHVPVVPAAQGRLRERFPTPHPLTGELLRDLYQECGLAAAHIGLLTGHPGASVQRHLHAAGVRLRPAGGRCPFLRRWRAAESEK